MNFRCAEIGHAEKALQDAEAAYAESVTSIQDACDHPVILERSAGMTGYQYIENSWRHAVRVCARCGYVEESDHWPSPRTKETPLYNTNPKSKSRLNRVDFAIDDDRLHKEIVRRS